MEHKKIIFEYEDFEGNYALESAWAEMAGNNYRLDNILFYASEYSLGDVVSVEDREGELYVTGLVVESGHSTIRILFTREEFVSNARDELKLLGCDSEVSNISTLVSVDIPSNIVYSEIKEFLEKGVKDGKWGYEESCLAHDN